MSTLLLSLAPVFILLAYVYFRDKYEKEPIGLIVRGLVAGAFIILPVALVEKGLILLFPSLTTLSNAFFQGYVVAGATEELFKFAAVYLLFWRNQNFNEKFDGIVYAVAVSLGFAAIENIMYVYRGSMEVGIGRAFTAVPAHTLFGVIMGYYLGLAKFVPELKTNLLWKAILFPWFFHGTYDFLILSGKPLLMVGFIPLLFFLWRTGLRRMKFLSDSSVFRSTPPPPPGPYQDEQSGT